MFHSLMPQYEEEKAGLSEEKASTQPRWRNLASTSCDISGTRVTELQWAEKEFRLAGVKPLIYSDD